MQIRAMQAIESYLSGRTYWQQFLLFLSVWLVCVGVTSMLSSLVVVSLYGAGAIQLLKSSPASNPNIVQTLKWVQVISSVGIFILPALFFSYLKAGSFTAYLTLNKRPALPRVLLSILVVILAAPTIYFILFLNQSITFPGFLEPLGQLLRTLEDDNAGLLEAFIEMPSVNDFILNIFMIAALPAIGEELLFRGTLQRFLGEWTKKPHLAIFVSSFIFSFIHLQFFGFFPGLLLGMLFGYLFYWGGSILYPIIAHFIHNGTQVVLAYLYQQETIAMDVENMDTMPWHVTVVSTILLLLTLNFFRKSGSRKYLKDE